MMSDHQRRSPRLLDVEFARGAIPEKATWKSPTGAEELDCGMRPRLVLIVLVPAAIGVLWQSQGSPPMMGPFASGLLLLILGGLLGLRLATDSATRFVGDLARLNAYLAEKNRDLAALNHRLLKELLRPGDERSDPRGGD